MTFATTKLSWRDQAKAEHLNVLPAYSRNN